LNIYHDFGESYTIDLIVIDTAQVVDRHVGATATCSAHEVSALTNKEAHQLPPERLNHCCGTNADSRTNSDSNTTAMAWKGIPYSFWCAMDW
jgi:hypothetical protein